MNEADRYDDKGLIHDRQRLKELQALPLERKIGITVALCQNCTQELLKFFDGAQVLEKVGEEV